MYHTIKPIAVVLLVGHASANNINGWTGCDATTQTPFVNQAYKDALRLADHVVPFHGHDELFQPTGPNDTVSTAQGPDALATRFFGQQSNTGSSQARYINSVYTNIEQWYPWPIFDWLFGKRIEVRCTDLENRCASVDGQQVAAYASNLDDGPKITFCSPFWQYPNLDDKKSQLDSTPGWQKDIKNFKTQGEIFLHEMTHLLVISGSQKIIDYKWPEGSAKAYGPKLCQKLARQSDKANTWDAILNADNYAMFASGSWFFQWYGLPIGYYNTFADEDSYTPTIADEEGIDDQPIDDSSFTVTTDYPASTGYAVDTAQVNDMLSWATVLTNYNSRGPQPTTPAGTMVTSVVSSSAAAVASTSVAGSASSSAPAPPTCTPNFECPDVPRPGALGQQCRCTTCDCSDGSKQVCNLNGKCVAP